MYNKPLPSGTNVGTYSIIKTISNGGMGMVYLARSDNGTPVVIKEYLPYQLKLRKNNVKITFKNVREEDKFNDGLLSFFNENEVLSKIKHPNMVSVLDIFLANNTAYSVMEFIYGNSLQQIILSEGDPGLKETFISKIALDILNGLGWLHRQRILHLDIKPSNIYITHESKAMLLDFGSAWLLDFQTQERREKVPMCTPGFAPAEQYKSYFSPNIISNYTDIYSFGCTLCSCLSGKSPTPSVNMINSGRIHNSKEKWMGYYSPWLLEIIDEMMRLDYKSRPKRIKDILNVFHANNAIDQENPIKIKSMSLISRTRHYEES